MKKTKLLFIIWTYSMGGGAEKILHQLVNALDPQRYNIDILEVEHFDKPIRESAPHIRVLAPIFRGSWSIRERLLRKIQMICPLWLRNRRTREVYDYEIAFNYMIPTFYLHPKRKTIVWMHGSIEHLLKDTAARRLQERQFPKIREFVAIAGKTRDSMEAVFPQLHGRIRLIYNGYNMAEVRRKAEEETTMEPDSLCYIGRLEVAKGVMELVELYASLRSRGLRQKLYLIGSGDQEQELKDKIKSLGLEQAVILTGYQANPYSYIRKASFVVSCSHAEGFPTIYVEGLILGVGFVSTVVGGVDELADGGRCGYYGSPAEMERYLWQELQKPRSERLISAAACKQFVSRFSLDHQVEALEDLLHRMDEPTNRQQ
ncbi:MAG: glycosyltransferase [Lachnospiraceae bacterium]|nr:glycosyltransferase [Lachnospiraceae bacterium]